ncbi:MAG: trehalose-phosphatase [Thermodesulfovibrionales bacterium]
MGKINKALYPRYFFGEINNSLLNKIKRYHKIALFLDYDGTLVPIQKAPSQCILSNKIKGRLKLLAGSDRCYLTILSGRSLPDIKKMAGIKNICYGGNHGLDIAGPNIRFTHPKVLSTRPLIIKIKKLLDKEIRTIKGAWLEDKKFTLSLHFRSARTKDIPRVKKVFYDVAGKFLEKNLLVVIKGKKVLELAPNVSWNKGKAVRWILQRLKGKYLSIYIGDDLTDETAFKALCKRGITIRVGKSKKTFADYYLNGYREVSSILKQIVELQSA